MNEIKEVPKQWENEGEKELTVLNSKLNRYKTKGLNPDAVIKIDTLISQANLEIRQNNAISTETLAEMKKIIQEYKE